MSDSIKPKRMQRAKKWNEEVEEGKYIQNINPCVCNGHFFAVVYFVQPTDFNWQATEMKWST